MPTYNGVAFLKEALSSALQQTYTHIEIVICDDGSTDGTIEFIKSQTDPRIRLVQNTSKRGMVANWNFCMQEAKGEWIKFLFQDDLLSPDCVQTMMEACIQFGAEAALCSRDFIVDDDVLPHLKRFFTQGIIKPENLLGNKTLFVDPSMLARTIRLYLLQNVLGEPPCYLIKKKLVNEIGSFKENMAQLVDYEFILRAGLSKGFVFIPQSLVHFRVHTSSQSSENNKLDKDSLIQYLKATAGDSTILLYEYQTNPLFAELRRQVGERNLANYVRHIYHTGCKHNGTKIMNQALEYIRAEHKDLVFSYSIFKYAYYRYLIKQYEHRMRAESRNS